MIPSDHVYLYSLLFFIFLIVVFLYGYAIRLLKKHIKTDTIKGNLLLNALFWGLTALLLTIAGWLGSLYNL